jgi:hypothetical protein
VVSRLSITELAQADGIEDGAAPFDLVLGFATEDTRSIDNLLKVQGITRQGIVFTVDIGENDEPSSATRKRRAARLKQLPGFTHVAWDGSQATEVKARLVALSLELAGQAPRLFVDVSALPRTILAALLFGVREVTESGISVHVTLGYCLAKYSPPNNDLAPANRRVAPAHYGLAGWPRSPGLPVHLIVGLGYESGKAMGAVEYLQPSQWRLFVPDSPEGRFIAKVREQNGDLIEGTREQDQFAYQVLDPIGQFAVLTSMLKSMVGVSKPVLLPFGPKIFFSVCVLLALQFPEVSVWHVSGEEQAAPTKRHPSANSVFFSFRLQEIEGSPFA